MTRQALSNTPIAARLSVTEATAEQHPQNSFVQLDTAYGTNAAGEVTYCRVDRTATGNRCQHNFSRYQYF
jgi:hypothetical protein